MTNSSENDCTCPSGDGSLRHPCPMHPAKYSNDELKVGDVISYSYLCEDPKIKSWQCVRMDDALQVEFFSQGQDVTRILEWQRGIHPSLIPEGFILVNKVAHNDWIGKIVADHIWVSDELVAARKEIERLRKVLEVEAAYCQKNADLLESSDKPRSLRHQDRADRLRDAIKPEDKQS